MHAATTTDAMTLSKAPAALNGVAVAAMTMKTSTVSSSGINARQVSTVPGRASHQSTANT